MTTETRKECRNTEKDADLALSRRHEKLLFSELSDKILELAINVHKKLGPGFIEKIYEKALVQELTKASIRFVNQSVIKVQYDNVELGEQRVDFMIEDKLIIEMKCVSELNNIHMSQMLSYLKTADKKVGLILNFTKPTLEIKRVVN